MTQSHNKEQNRFFFAAIHCIAALRTVSISHAIANIQTAQSAGCDGVFLVANGVPLSGMIKICESVRQIFPNFFIGANLLQGRMKEEEISKLQYLTILIQRMNALWSDYIPRQDPKLSRYSTDMKFFSSIAMKYQNPNPDPHTLRNNARMAQARSDAIVTSGDRTGTPPTQLKIEMIRTVLSPSTPLIIASGIAVENVRGFRDADGFIVGTSISERDHHHEYGVCDMLDVLKINALRAAINEMPINSRPTRRLL